MTGAGVGRGLLLLAAVVLGLGVLATAWRLWREARQGRAARTALLTEAEPLLAAPRRRIEPSGFPRLAGRFVGREVDLQAVPDALALRKLPALWLLATLTEPQPLAGETRIMQRPSGLEPFSTFADLPAEVTPPPGAPAGCVLRTTSPCHLPPAAILAAGIRLFEDPAVKELVFSPKGLRLVRLVEEAPRGGYLLFRDADLGRAPIPAAVARRMLDALVALSGELARG